MRRPPRPDMGGIMNAAQRDRFDGFFGEHCRRLIAEVVGWFPNALGLEKRHDP